MSNSQSLRPSTATPSPRLSIVERITATRGRRAALSAASGLTARGITLFVTLATIPIALNYLGSERFGIWATLTAIISLLAFADLGIGNGLINLIAEESADGDEAGKRRALSSAIAIVCGVVAVLAPIAAIAYVSVDWRAVLAAPGDVGASEVDGAVALLLIVTIVAIPLGLASKVLIAHQQGYLFYAWSAVGAMASLVALLAVTSADVGTVGVVAATLAVPTAVTLVGCVWTVRRRHPLLRPSISGVRRQYVNRLLQLGFMFFVLQVVIAVAFQADVVIAAHTVGPTGAAEYAVLSRLFLTTPQVIGIALLPLWPAYTDSIRRGDLKWLQSTLRRSVGAAAAVAGIASLVILAASPAVFGVIGHVNPNVATLAGFAVWAVMSSVGTALAMLFNGAAAIRFQVIVAGAMGLTSVSLSILLGQSYGVAGIIWGTVVAYGLISLSTQLWYAPRLIRRLRDRPEPALQAQFAAGVE